MNTKILQKCVEELKKEIYSKEYVLGMLETVIEMQPTYYPPNSGTFVLPTLPTNDKTYSSTRTESVSDEEEIPPFLRVGPTGGNQI